MAFQEWFNLSVFHSYFHEAHRGPQHFTVITGLSCGPACANLPSQQQVKVMGLEQSQTQVEEGNGTSGPHMNQFFSGSSNKSWSSCDENWYNSPRRSVVSLGTYLTGINSSAEPNHSIRSEIKVPRENQCPLSTTLISHPPLVLTFISPWKGFCLLGIMCHSSLGSCNFSQVQVIAELCQMPHALHQVAQGKLQFLGGRGETVVLAFTSTAMLAAG